MDEQTLDNFDGLTPSQFKKVMKLINDFGHLNKKIKPKKKAAPKPQKVAPVVKKRGRPKKQKPENPPIAPVLPPNEPQAPIKNAPRVVKVQKRGTIKGREDKGVPTRNAGPVARGPRPNSFLKSVDFRAAKEDVAIDKKLAKYAPMERGNRQLTLLELECSSCGETFQVSEELVADAERWRCNTCCLSPAGDE